ncbi:MAG: 1,6-anhydro-N-acetylmuramyl-L-alanine amidase AmpD [Alteromonadaceae bacterium]|nr:1,6-anhydro-N-acetylmuramyl-L-alanine amidase AmpD [Alteromonadaceae bacterium]
MNKDNTLFQLEKGCLLSIEQQKSPHFNERSCHEEINLLVIHNISLPAGQFGGEHITNLFLGKLDLNSDKSFVDLKGVRVSAHCLIRRDGNIIQYVNFNDKAWHAGVSSFCGREQCNDFSIGIELEGTDNIDYTSAQYQQLVKLTKTLQQYYPAIITGNIIGHCDIAPSRKTDPGRSFNWQYFRQCLQ